MSRVRVVVVILVALALASCGGAPVPPTATPNPTATTTVFVSPLSPLAAPTDTVLPLNSGRSKPALDGYSQAEAAAKEWSGEAFFLGISPSSFMARNLPRPITNAGWFYRFGRPSDTLDYYVQVEDGVVTGVYEVQDIRSATVQRDPLDITAVKLDSTDARQLYLDELGVAQANDDLLDYALEFDPARGGPVWLVYDLSQSGEPVLTVDAATGEVLFPR